MIHAPSRDIDTIETYMTDIGQFVMINKEQEIALARRIRRKAEAEAALAALDPDDPARADLEAIIEDAQAAWEALVTANLRLVVSIAKKYFNHNLDLRDLISAGNEGLMTAAWRFDAERGHKFSTYATWWIRQGVTRWIAVHSRTVRLPVHVGEALNKLMSAKHRLCDKLERDPTVEELAAATGYDEKKVKYLLEATLNIASLDKSQLAPNKVRDHGSTLGDMIAADQVPIEDAVADNELAQKVQQALSILDERERFIIERRYGFGQGQAYTLAEIGSELGITRERARQIQMQAESKLREHGNLKGLLSV